MEWGDMAGQCLQRELGTKQTQTLGSKLADASTLPSQSTDLVVEHLKGRVMWAVKLAST